MIALIAIAGCGGGDSPPQLVDGTTAGEPPAALNGLGDAVLTRAVVENESDLDPDEYEACAGPRDGGDRTVVERTGLNGSSLTIESGRLLFGCDRIPDPLTAEDPDLPYGGIWCASPNGRLSKGGLNDPRLSLCPNTNDEYTAFAWVEPRPAAKWIVVSDTGTSEVYEVAESLPVRVTTTHGVEPERARVSFDVAEYAADGRRLRQYVLTATVAG